MKKCYLGFIFSAIILFLVSCAGTNHNSKGILLLQQGQLEEAYSEFEKAYEEDPDSPFTLNNMGYLYEMKYSDYSKAVSFYRSALEKCSPKDIIKYAADKELVEKPLKEAIVRNLKRAFLKLRRMHKKGVSS